MEWRGDSRVDVVRPEAWGQGSCGDEGFFRSLPASCSGPGFAGFRSGHIGQPSSRSHQYRGSGPLHGTKGHQAVLCDRAPAGLLSGAFFKGRWKFESGIRSSTTPRGVCPGGGSPRSECGAAMRAQCRLCSRSARQRHPEDLFAINCGTVHPASGPRGDHERRRTSPRKRDSFSAPARRRPHRDRGWRAEAAAGPGAAAPAAAAAARSRPHSRCRPSTGCRPRSSSRRTG
jgi:hypothetical protein